ncbi:MAG: DUF2024 family protein, partial [Flavobacteriales bacterium]|nr:DUF2024 family protein [Flavobacteriales bacterium]
MRVAIWDTYVPKKDSNIMHFDIIVPEEMKDKETIFKYGNEFLKSKGLEGLPITTEECKFCHTEHIKPHWEESILTKG